MPRVNEILGDNPFASAPRLERVLQPVSLKFGDVLHATERIEHVYFPVDCLVSLLAPLEGHQSIECGVIGSEGMVGVPIALGMNTSPIEAKVQTAGTALRMRASAFRRELKNDSALQTRLHRYIHVLMGQLAQTAACNTFHQIEARCARWLLTTRERIRSNELELTQEFLAQMLGVRRVGVTVAAGNLQRRGLIAYSRGRIVILDPERLAEAACECYQARARPREVADGRMSLN